MSRFRLAAEIVVVLVGAFWYAVVLWKTWPVGLTFWPLWVLAYVAFRPVWRTGMERVSLRRAARGTAHRPT